MLITRTNLDALRTQLDLRYAQAYQEVQTFWEKLATPMPSNAKFNTYGWAAQSVELREWVGPRVALNLKEHDYTLQNKTYEGTLQVKREEIEDDNIGVFSNAMIPNLATAVKKHPDRLIKAMLQSSSLAFDGIALFNASHLTYAPVGSTQTYSNVHADLDLDAAGFDTIYAQMASIIGENGEVLGITPNLIIVPPQLAREAKVIMQSTTYAIPGSSLNTATVDNPLRGMCDVLVVPELANEPNVWYVADTTKAVKPFVYQLRRAAELVARQNPDDPRVFDEDVFTWGVSIRDAVGITLPFLIAKATHTP